MALRKFAVTALILTIATLQSCSSIPASAPDRPLTGQSADRLFVLVGQADAAYQRSQWDDASALYQKVLALIPDDPYAWFRLGNSLTQSGQYYKAIFAFETSLQHDSLQTKPWFNLSTAHLLGAQLATLRAMDSMDINDSARQSMQNRLNALTLLLQ